MRPNAVLLLQGVGPIGVMDHDGFRPQRSGAEGGQYGRHAGAGGGRRFRGRMISGGRGLATRRLRLTESSW